MAAVFMRVLFGSYERKCASKAYAHHGGILSSISLCVCVYIYMHIHWGPSTSITSRRCLYDLIAGYGTCSTRGSINPLSLLNKRHYRKETLRISFMPKRKLPPPLCICKKKWRIFSALSFFCKPITILECRQRWTTSNGEWRQPQLMDMYGRIWAYKWFIRVRWGMCKFHGTDFRGICREVLSE